jgi:hypothetical protein
MMAIDEIIERLEAIYKQTPKSEFALLTLELAKHVKQLKDNSTPDGTDDREGHGDEPESSNSGSS